MHLSYIINANLEVYVSQEFFFTMFDYIRGNVFAFLSWRFCLRAVGTGMCLFWLFDSFDVCTMRYWNFVDDIWLCPVDSYVCGVY